MNQKAKPVPNTAGAAVDAASLAVILLAVAAMCGGVARRTYLS
jgi:hypothetical protein